MVFSSSTIYDTHLAGITLQIVDGGTLDRVTVSDINMDNVGTAVFIRLGDRARPFTENMARPGIGKLSHVILDNIQGTRIGKTGCSITGLPGSMVEDIMIGNIFLEFDGGGSKALIGREIPEKPEAYPEHNMFGDLPSYGFFCRHCKNISFDNIVLRYDKPEERPPIIFDDVEGLWIRGLRAAADGSASVVVFTGVKSALIQECVTQGSPDIFLNLEGSDNLHISMTGNDFSRCKTAVCGNNRSSVFLDANRMPPSYGLSDGPFVNCGVQFTDDREIRINTPADVRNKRQQIIRAIWGKDKIPERADPIVSGNIQGPLTPDPVVSRVDRLEVPVGEDHTRGDEKLKDLAYLFVPVSRNNRLVILNPGHTCKLNSQPGTDYRIEQAIKGLLKAGFDVLAVFMPHVTETTCNLDHCSIMNTDLGPGEHPSTYGLRFFLDPAIVCLNYLLGVTHYENVNMVGLSGGGWTANLLAAIDTRIKYSFNVAGSMPLYYRSGGSIGDVEQFLPELYRDIAGYPDIYVLGAFGNGRMQVQILNRKDDCCFGQAQHDPERSWDKDLDSFELSVKKKLKRMGADGHYYLVKDETAACHQISEFALDKVIIKELNAGRK